MDTLVSVLGQSPFREVLAALGGALLALAIERVRQRLSRNEALVSEAAKLRLAAYGRVLAAVGPVAGLAFFASVHATAHDEPVPRDLSDEFKRAHAHAAKAILTDSLLLGQTTTMAMLGFVAYTERLLETVNTTTDRNDPRRAEVVSKFAAMVRSVEKALPRFAQLPNESHFGQHQLSTIYTDVGIWTKSDGKYEIVNPGE